LLQPLGLAIMMKMMMMMMITIIIRDNKEGTCMLIDVAFSGDGNVIKKETEKTLRYKGLTTEITRIWNVKTEETGATGTISQLFRKYLRNISGKHEIKEIQKAAILWAAHTHTHTHTHYGKY